jgi:hypothetical protein
MFRILDKLTRAQGDILGVLSFGLKCGASPCANSGDEVDGEAPARAALANYRLETIIAGGSRLNMQP